MNALIERLPYKLRGTAMTAVVNPTPRNISSLRNNAQTCWPTTTERLNNAQLAYRLLINKLTTTRKAS